VHALLLALEARVARQPDAHPHLDVVRPEPALGEVDDCARASLRLREEDGRESALTLRLLDAGDVEDRLGVRPVAGHRAVEALRQVLLELVPRRQHAPAQPSQRRFREGSVEKGGGAPHGGGHLLAQLPIEVAGADQPLQS